MELVIWGGRAGGITNQYRFLGWLYLSQRKIKQGWGAGEPCLLCRVIRKSLSDKVAAGRDPKEMMIQITSISGGRTLKVEEAASAKTHRKEMVSEKQKASQHIQRAASVRQVVDETGKGECILQTM